MHRSVSRLVAVSVSSTALVLAGCASSTVSTVHQGKHFGYEEWQCALNERQINLTAPVYPFAATPELKTWAQETLGSGPGIGNAYRLKRLQEAMFDRKAFDFEYVEELTLTGAEAFQQRRGNCMSFTALFIAAARSVGIDAYLVAVRRPPEVEKKGDLVVINDHVVAGYNESGRIHIYDFYLTSKMPYLQQTIIDDVTATALYHNNQGGAALRAGKLDEALSHLQLAIRLDPSMPAVWVNLGVTRHRLGDENGAIAAYNKALEIEPGHSSALANMAVVYKKMGLEEESREALKEASRRRSTPFVLISLAEAEQQEGNLEQAARYLAKARRLDRKEPEVYLAMARLAVRSGDIITAGKLRTQARKLQQQREGDSE